MEEKKSYDEMTERELLAELLKQQTRSSKNSKILVAIMGVITAVVIVIAVLIVPKAMKTLDEANTLVGQGQSTLSQVDGMIGGMQALVKNLDDLVESNTDVITDSIAKINGLDFDALNKSIRELGDVLEPLAQFFNLF